MYTDFFQNRKKVKQYSYFYEKIVLLIFEKWINFLRNFWIFEIGDVHRFFIKSEKSETVPRFL